MPRIRAVRAHARIQFANTDLRPTSRPVAEDADRASLIRECLRDLEGIELIYAIRCKDGTIKIGHSADIRNRFKFFGVPPESLLFIRPGTYDDEQAIHAMLEPHVARGREYYHPHAEVLAYVNGVRSRLGLDAVA